jgi:hypothetical protein
MNLHSGDAGDAVGSNPHQNVQNYMKIGLIFQTNHVNDIKHGDMVMELSTYMIQSLL